MDNNEIKQFDRVQITTTKNIEYLSDVGKSAPTPDGIWTVVGNVGSDVLMNKGTTVVSVPVSDIIKIGDYSVSSVLEKVEQQWQKKLKKKKK